MAEKDIIAKELLAMQELDGVIATYLPNVRTNDSKSVAQLQQLLNIRYPDSLPLAIDGQMKSKTMASLQTWLSKTQYLNDLEPGARNTVINPDVARAEGRANGYTPFQDTMLAETVNQAAKGARGMNELISEVIGDVSMEELA